MKSDTTNQTWKPTLTMAKLYEEQNQFYDALAIYEIISQTDTSPEVREKIELLQTRILHDPNLRYDPRIEKLFSQEELTYLKILNHSAFENLSRLHTQFIQGASDYEVVLEEDEPSIRPTVSSFEVRRMVEEIDTLAEPQKPVTESENLVSEQPEAIPEEIETKSEPQEPESDSFITAPEDLEHIIDELETIPEGSGTESESLISMLRNETFEPLTEETETPAMYIEPPAEEYNTLTEEFDPVSEQPEVIPEPEIEEPTINDLAEELVNFFGKDSQLSSISVQEFMQVVLRHNLQNKTDKDE